LGPKGEVSAKRSLMITGMKRVGINEGGKKGTRVMDTETPGDGK